MSGPVVCFHGTDMALPCDECAKESIAKYGRIYTQYELDAQLATLKQQVAALQIQLKRGKSFGYVDGASYERLEQANADLRQQLQPGPCGKPGHLNLHWRDISRSVDGSSVVPAHCQLCAEVQSLEREAAAKAYERCAVEAASPEAKKYPYPYALDLIFKQWAAAARGEHQ